MWPRGEKDGDGTERNILNGTASEYCLRFGGRFAV